ncbi:30S ribosomal protein S6 [Patescibacteria group bacterium AH-259-L07]|nr:30S ribosomal protein S6 [Patescibacteria group bacterium AH-259-L07]
MYELLYIVPAPYTEKDLEGISQKIKKIISDLEGTITHEENLGGKKLAYPIKSIHRGFYLLVRFDINAKKLNELNQKLKLTSEVLRHIITAAIKTKPRLRARPKRKKEEFDDIFKEEIIKGPSLTKPARPAGGAAEDKEEKDVSAEVAPEKKEEAKEKEEKKPKKPKKVDFKKLGDKIDELLKI